MAYQREFELLPGFTRFLRFHPDSSPSSPHFYSVKTYSEAYFEREITIRGIFKLKLTFEILALQFW